MAVQGCRPGRKPHGQGGLPEGVQDLFSARNLIDGANEGLFGVRYTLNLY